jgi:hypothetical protein
MSHWTVKYIGADYGEVGLCWGLVQRVCRERFGVEMPGVDVGSEDDQTAKIKRAARLSGWRPVLGPFPAPDDIVTMLGRDGRHVGFAVHDGVELGILHAKGVIEHGKPVGAVVFDSWPEMIRAGFYGFEFWRRSA